VDVRRGSPTFGRWIGQILTADDFRQVFVPAGFAHGFCVLSDAADVMYKCTDFYDAGGESGLPWDDAALAIPWPVTDPLLSPRDRRHSPFSPDRWDFPEWAAGRLLWPDREASDRSG
jgi:dTDP-4-dehydrorhamnose 3,5-epimerase